MIQKKILKNSNSYKKKKFFKYVLEKNYKYNLEMKIKAAIIGTGVGEKHFEAIEKYRDASVEIICEKK